MSVLLFQLLPTIIIIINFIDFRTVFVGWRHDVISSTENTLQLRSVVINSFLSVVTKIVEYLITLADQRNENEE